MKVDIFGNEITDNRSEVRKKIDNIWDEYCKLFDTYISLDDFRLSEDDFLEIMTRSISENVDYLARFVLRDEVPNKQNLIKDIVEIENEEISKLLDRVHTTLSLQELNSEKQYMILRMFYCTLMEFDGNRRSLVDILLDDVQKKNLSDVILEAKEYQWWPEEIYDLRNIRQEVLSEARDLYAGRITGNIISKKDIDSRVDEIYNVIQVTNYEYVCRNTIQKEYTFLKEEIEKDCNFILSNGRTEHISMGLLDIMSDVSLFSTELFSTDGGFKNLKFSQDE